MANEDDELELQDNPTEEAAESAPMEQQLGIDDIGKGADIIKSTLDYGRRMHGLSEPSMRESDGQGMNLDQMDQRDPSLVEDRRGDFTPNKIANRLRNTGPAYGLPGARDAGNGVPLYAEGGTVEDEDEDVLRQRSDELQAEMRSEPEPRRAVASYGRVDDKSEPNEDEGLPVQAEDKGMYGKVKRSTAPTERREPPATGSPAGLPEQAPGPTPVERVQGGLKRIMAYLQGADAAPPEISSRYEEMADPTQTLDEGARKAKAIELATEEGGPEAGWRLMQKYRKNYDTYKAHAAGALSRGDIQNAAISASKAYPNVPDGTQMQFTPTETGVTATVAKGGKVVMQTPLTAPQFNQWLLGVEGQYDHVMDVGADKLLQKLAASAGLPISQPGTQMQQGQAQQLDRVAQRQTGGMQQPQPGQPQQAGRGEALRDTSGRRTSGQDFSAEGGRAPPGQAYQDLYETDPVRQQAQRIFPMASQNQQREAHIEQQQQAGEKARTERIKAETPLGVAQTRAEGGVAREGVHQQGARDVAQIRATAYQNVAQIRAESKTAEGAQKLQGVMAQVAQREKNTQVAAMAKIIETKLKNIPLGGDKLTPQEEAFVLRMANTQQAPAPQQQQAPASGQAPATPAFKPGPGWQKSPSTGQYRDPQGNVYDKDGNKLN